MGIDSAGDVSFWTFAARKALLMGIETPERQLIGRSWWEVMDQATIWSYAR